MNVNLDGEPMLVKQFRVECRQRVLPVHLSDQPADLEPLSFVTAVASTPLEEDFPS